MVFKLINTDLNEISNGSVQVNTEFIKFSFELKEKVYKFQTNLLKKQFDMEVNSIQDILTLNFY